MTEKEILKQEEKDSLEDSEERVSTIIQWLEKIDQSDLSISCFFKENKVPFSRSQYFVYKKRYKELGSSGISVSRSAGGNRKLDKEAEAFICGCVTSKPDLSPEWLRKQLIEKYGYKLSASGVTRALARIAPNRQIQPRGRPRVVRQEGQINPTGGFELIVALAYHLGWPQMLSDIVIDEVENLKNTEVFKYSENRIDRRGRDKLGKFTKNYSKRKQIRENRFAPISEKRLYKNWKSMKIVYEKRKTIERKSIAVLSLPIVTMNGSIRNVNSAHGQALKHFCGYDYKQGTVTKYLNELKYLGVSPILLQYLVKFWHKYWGADINNLSNEKLVCYYIDGNTKALWSTKRVKKNKVTMYGRVMGCIEHVFIHDCFGRPIYFETYPGHGPSGDYILGLFERIEDSINEMPGEKMNVCRAIVMDSAGNSVQNLRAFASQEKYYYITALDENQWNERKVVSIGSAIRYEYGQATLREVVIDLEDSRPDEDYVIRTSGIKIDWDTGKMTVLITNLPLEIVGSSEVVRGYFNRWPSEELQFKSMKAVASLHRVAGYGKKKIKDEKLVDRQVYAARRIEELEKTLEDPLERIRGHEEAIAELIPKERCLRSQSKIEDGKLRLPEPLMKQFNTYGREIRSHKGAIKKIEKEAPKEFKLLRKHRREWLRLQGKETVYKVDVELDQIITFHRVSLVNLYAYFVKHFLGGQPLSLSSFLHRIIHLPATIEETANKRKIVIDYNEKDRLMMKVLAGAIEKLNATKTVGPQGKIMEFDLKEAIV